MPFIASALTTGISVWEDTGSRLKGFQAFGIDLSLSIAAGVIIGAAVRAAPKTVAGVIALGVTVAVVTVAAILVEKAIFDFLGIPTGFLRRYQRKIYALGPVPDPKGEDFPPFQRLKPLGVSG